MHKILVFLGIICLFSACSATKKSSNLQLNGNWELALFPTTDKTFDEVFGQRKPTLQFDVAGKKVSGTTGCNRLSGSYSSNKESFSFDNNIITTKMACPGYEESIFLNALTKVNRYKIENGQLQFLRDSTLLMAFSKK